MLRILLPVLVGMIFGNRLSFAQDNPHIAIDSQFLVMNGVPEIVTKAEVDRHLHSGLTTTFIFEVTGVSGNGDPLRGASAVEIRYDLWDECYLVTAVDVRGRGPSQRLLSRNALVEWWRTRTHHVARAPAENQVMPTQYRVRLSVIPFSESEQQDTQSWFSHTMEKTTQSLGEGVPSNAKGGVPFVQKVFSVMMAASIARSSVLTYSWQVTLSSPEAN